MLLYDLQFLTLTEAVEFDLLLMLGIGDKAGAAKVVVMVFFVFTPAAISFLLGAARILRRARLQPESDIPKSHIS